MASSPIRINEATAEELGRLPQIGPSRAERIVSYREQVATLEGVRDLASVAGISQAAAIEVARLIDWTGSSRSLAANLFFALCATVACGGLAWFALRGYDITKGGPAETLYSTSITLVLLGSFAMIGYLFAMQIGARPRSLGWTAASCLASGTMLLAALLVALYAKGSDDDFTRHVFATTELAVFVSIIVVLIYGPGWHVRNFSQHFDLAARYFDIGQVLLAAATIALLTMRDQPSLIELLFGIWVGVTVMLNSREMIKGHSGYSGSLSQRELARLAFFTSGDGSTPPDTGLNSLTRPSGIILAVLSAILVLEAVLVLVPID